MNRCLVEKEQEMVDLYYNYLKEGASVLTSYTFRTGGLHIQRAIDKDPNLGEAFKSPNLVKQAVSICKQAIKKYREEENDENGLDRNRKILIAGSNPPATFCYDRTAINQYSDEELI